MKSIIQNERECFVCGNPRCEDHHIFYGTANRKFSEKYGLKVWLCPRHHRGTKDGVHFDPDFDLSLKRLAQARFDETYEEDFQEVFGKSYL